MQRYLLSALLFAALACRPDVVERERGGAGEDERPVVLILGTSLTAGLGVDPADAYPALLQRKIDSAGYDYQVRNAGVSGETSAGALQRINWVLRDNPAILVVETGANDGLRGLPVTALGENLDSILSLAERHRPPPRLMVVGMEAPPNLGGAYTTAFRRVFRDVAAAHDAVYVPFLLLRVAGVPSLNTADGIHPNERGHERMAETVWLQLEDMLGSLAR